MIIPTSNKAFIPNISKRELLNKIELSISKTLELKSVLKAIMDVTKTFDALTEHKAYLVTKGVLVKEINLLTKYFIFIKLFLSLFVSYLLYHKLTYPYKHI